MLLWKRTTRPLKQAGAVNVGSDTLIRGIHVARGGDGRKALEYFARAAVLNPHSPLPWLWASACVPNRYAKLECLHRALQAAPENRFAREGVRKLLSVDHYSPPFLPGTFCPLTSTFSLDTRSAAPA
jgi:hypothetical protein